MPNCNLRISGVKKKVLGNIPMGVLHPILPFGSGFLVVVRYAVRVLSKFCFNSLQCEASWLGVCPIVTAGFVDHDQTATRHQA